MLEGSLGGWVVGVVLLLGAVGGLGWLCFGGRLALVWFGWFCFWGRLAVCGVAGLWGWLGGCVVWGVSLLRAFGGSGVAVLWAGGAWWVVGRGWFWLGWT